MTITKEEFLARVRQIANATSLYVEISTAPLDGGYLDAVAAHDRELATLCRNAIWACGALNAYAKSRVEK